VTTNRVTTYQVTADTRGLGGREIVEGAFGGRVSGMRMSNMSVGNASADSTGANNMSANNTRAERASVSKPSRTDLAGRHVVALGLAIVSLAASERAAADCTPQSTQQSPVNSATVTCTGATLNQNKPAGYGTGNETGITINVQSGASVTGDGAGLTFSDGTVSNFGTISGRANGIFSAHSFIVTNFGTISGGTGGVGIFVNNGAANVSNFGTISGGTAIDANLPSTIANAGTIIGFGGTAIRLAGGADTLTLLPGSRIIGAIDMGGGNDVVNFSSSRGIGQLITLQNFTGTINTSGPGLVFHSATQIATLDPTAFALADLAGFHGRHLGAGAGPACRRGRERPAGERSDRRELCAG
jgi:hypothetical protein